LPLKGILPEFLIIDHELTRAIQLPFQVLFKDVPYSKIIKTPFSSQPLKMLPWFPVQIPWIVVLIAGPIFPATFDSYFLKILDENPLVITYEGFKRAGI
jgi:hypothetical protein